jgi:hypothetical protein
MLSMISLGHQEPKFECYGTGIHQSNPRTAGGIGGRGGGGGRVPPSPGDVSMLPFVRENEHEVAHRRSVIQRK